MPLSCDILKKALMSVLICGLLISLGGCDSKAKNDRIKNFSVLNPDKDFTLKDQDGNDFHLRDHRGKVVLLFFGYLTCPDICPVTLSKLSRAYQLLGERSKNVLTLFITIDPSRDTPQKIKEYLDFFKLNAIGLTGTQEEINKVVDALKANYQKVETDSAAGYLMDHSDYVYLIDGQGRVNELIHTDDTAEKIAGLIKGIL